MEITRIKEKNSLHTFKDSTTITTEKMMFSKTNDDVLYKSLIIR